MLRNYLRVAFRTLAKNRLYTFTNVLGLALGLMGCGLIGLVVFDEWRVDRFHTQGDRLYRVTTTYTANGAEGGLPTVGRALVPAIAAEVPEVAQTIAVRRANVSIKHRNQYFFDKALYAGTPFLAAFSFPLRAGDARTALRDPFTLVLTETLARKYFGDGPALGKTLMIRDTIPFRVTGVLADPAPSHLSFEVLLSLPTFYALGGDARPWFTWDEYCYVLLRESADPVRAEQKISALSMHHNGPEYRGNGYQVAHALEPLPDIHLHSPWGGVERPSGNARQLYLLGLVGVFVLLLACGNFVNLTTAYQDERTKEVGIRKAIGAGSGAVAGQFISESVLLALLSGVVAGLGVVVLLPFLNTLTEKTIPLTLLGQPATLLAALGGLLATGLLAGWYPALLLARFRPVDSLKGRVSAGQSRFGLRGARLRQGLVVFQFTVSLVLIIGTLVMARQLRFLQRQPLGFDQHRVLIVDLGSTPRRQFINQYESVKQQVAGLANVQAVTGAAALPGRSGWSGQLVVPEGRPPESALTFEVIPVDHDYAQTLGLTLRSGRAYSKAYGTDAETGVLLNEAACRAIGWGADEAIGKKIATSGMENGQVVGVLRDYHQHGLQQRVEPVLTFISPNAYQYLAIRLGPGDLPASVAQVQQYWQSAFPGYPFEYFFLDEDFNRQYQAERRLSTVFSLFAGLAVLIACLGLFALATFTAERRTKEIGVRKVLGASVTSIVVLLSKDFLKLVLIAIVIASPLAWYALQRWLEDFAYKVDVEWWVFALAGLLTVAIALLTVSFQSIKAALMNPVQSLRSE